MITDEQKAARRPSLLEQMVNKLVADGIPREDAILQVAKAESEARRTAVLNELTEKDPKLMKPTCPGCGADPMAFKRLRYDFKDGVLLETIFCNNPDCRIVLGTQIVFVPGKARNE